MDRDAFARRRARAEPRLGRRLPRRLPGEPAGLGLDDKLDWAPDLDPAAPDTLVLHKLNHTVAIDNAFGPGLAKNESGTAGTDWRDFSGEAAGTLVRFDGGAGQDGLWGHAGSDILVGGAGDDTLSGGAGTTGCTAATATNSSTAATATTSSSARPATTRSTATPAPTCSSAATATTSP